MNIFEKLYKSLVHNLFHMFKVILITVAYFHSIILEHII